MPVTWNGYQDHSGVRTAQGVCTTGAISMVKIPYGAKDGICLLIPPTVCGHRSLKSIVTGDDLFITILSEDVQVWSGVEAIWIPAVTEFKVVKSVGKVMSCSGMIKMCCW